MHPPPTSIPKTKLPPTFLAPPPLQAPATFNTASISTFLQPPPNTKLFLISPPGSPPSDWEPIEESAPNNNTGIDKQPNLVFLEQLHEKLTLVANTNAQGIPLPVFYIEDTSVAILSSSAENITDDGGKKGCRREEIKEKSKEY